MAACLATYGGAVPFREEEGSPKITAGRESRKIVRTGFIRWANIDALILELFPAPPSMFGKHPTATYLYAESLEVEPVADELANWMSTPYGVAVYTSPTDHAHREEAKATITYSTMPNPTGTVVSVKVGIGGEYQMVNPINMVWSDTGDPIKNEDAKIGKFIPTAEWSFTRQRATSVPWAIIRACVGRVNAGPLNSFPFYNVSAETLLMTGSEIGFSFAADGNSQWTLDYRFHERIIAAANVATPTGGPGGWNHVYRENDNTWAKVLPASGGSPIQYPTTALFLALFA